ncbi:DedA family protein [Dokdonella sp.]|uniref:DedA family protein n=1 Tax=Dokdonella sp. TaxID=2291710 RepID=UPI001B0AD8CE|nr:DedA family protein [Dokdonella sp.]MBO9661719.1 DedA family protein [Dokdonella sp.]
MDIPGPLAALLAWGLPGIAVIALGEKLIPLVPSYVLYVFLGMTAVSGSGALVVTILAATLGSSLGALAWYGLGRALGERRTEAAVERWGRWVFLPPQRYRHLAGLYRRNHFIATLLGQVTPVVRIYLPLPAGVLALALAPFTLAIVLGNLAWDAALLGIGYALRGSGGDPLKAGIAVVVGLLLIETLAVLALRWRARNRRPA